MPKEVRGDLHLRFADWLVEAAADRLAEHEEIVASHLERAIGYRMELGIADEETAGIATSTLRHLESATERASGRGDRWAMTKLIDRRLACSPSAIRAGSV